jgi:glycosyltransferase involved in cell wall biosynthesis
VLDQIDPGPVEFKLVAEEMRLHPEIAGPPAEFPFAYYERNRREWELADILIVNSEWSREALISEGADPAKIEILPLAYETKTENPNGESKNEFQLSAFNITTLPPLRVLWLGQVNVRKGIHHLMAAARLLKGENIQFDIVGPIGILPETVKSAPPTMRFHGPVSRDRAGHWYRQSDVFVLPTLSDGFALTQLEAMARGLPVIATPNCGRVVESGKTGFLVPPRDPQSLAAAILNFANDRNLSASMAPACRAAVNSYSIEAFGSGLVDIIQKRMAILAR